ncbi:MAG: thioredoxin family protein [Thermoproteota archaeon]
MAKVLEVDVDDWEQEVLQCDVLTVVDFWHDFCSWCKKLNPILEEVAEEYKEEIRFVKMNILEPPDNREIAREHGIMSVPTLMFFCEGRSVRQYLGFMPKDDLKEKIEETLEEYEDCIKRSTPLET